MVNKKNTAVYLKTSLILVLLIIFHLPATEYWAGLNKDGHFRNASDSSISGTLSIKWTKNLVGFSPMTFNSQVPYMGQRSNNFSVRDSKIALIVPSNTFPNATFGIIDLNSGNLISQAQSTHTNGGKIISDNFGRQDTDTRAGLIHQYWRADSAIFTQHGGDNPLSSVFNAYTGLQQAGQNTGNWNSHFSSNSSAYFSMTNANPKVFAVGGSGAHKPFSEGYWGYLDENDYPETSGGLNSMKLYSSFLVEADSIYSFNSTGTLYSGVGAQYLGVDIRAFKPATQSNTLAQDWLYSDSSINLLGTAPSKGMGAPRAITLGEDNNIYFYGFTLTQPYSLVAMGVNSSNGTEVMKVNIPFVDSLEEFYMTFFQDDFTKGLYPQAATRSNYLIIFQPQQEFPTRAPYNTEVLMHARVYCIDLNSKSLLWRKDYPWGYFQTMTTREPAIAGIEMGIYFVTPTAGIPEYSREQAVQLVISGDQAYIVEPLKNPQGNLELRVESFNLLDGANSSTTLTPLDSGSNPISITDSISVSLRELAAVDGKLVALVDYDRFNQALVTIEGLGSTKIKEGEKNILNTDEVQVLPNPFNPSTTIQFSNLRAGNVILNIYNARGQFIRQLLNSQMLKAGNHKVIWDGKNEQGKKMGNGSYFYRLISGTQSVTRTMFLIK